MKRIFTFCMILTISLLSTVIIFTKFNRVDNYSPVFKSCSFEEFSENVIRMYPSNMVSIQYENIEEDSNINDNVEQQSLRLIVKSKRPVDGHGALYESGYYDGLQIFQYSSYSDMKKAMNYFNSLEYVEYVEEDSVISISEYEDEEIQTIGLQDEFSYTTWGASVMGIEEYSNYLINKVGVNNLNDVVIAVLDSGIDTDHEWFVDRIVDGGRNFSGTGTLTDYEDVLGHGTHVSGIICDLTLSNVKILPIKTMHTKSGKVSNLILAIDYIKTLKNSGMNIVALNMSLGVYTSDNAINDAVNSLYENNMLSIAGAGNDTKDVSTFAPANVECAITVASIDKTKLKSGFSNYGISVDVCAPGSAILSAKVGGGTVIDSGTSMAAPHVTAAVALLYSDSSKTYSLKDIEKILKRDAEDLGGDGWDKLYGEGLVNIKNAYLDYTCDVTFSHTDNAYYEPFYLELTTTDMDVDIYYTIDNTIPSIINGMKYESPIYVDKSMIIQARAIGYNLETIQKIGKISKMRYCINNLDIDNAYTISANGEILGYDGVLTDLTIPSVIDGITIVSIGNSAFLGEGEVKSITLPDTITIINPSAFAFSSSLQTFNAPGVTSIGGMYTFMECEALTSVSFPVLISCGQLNTFTGCKKLSSVYMPSVKSLSKECFFNCMSLVDVTMNNLEYVSTSAFAGCESLPSIDLPSVTTLRNEVFKGCKSLVSINAPKATTLGYGVFGGCKKLIDISSLKNVENMGAGCFSGCSSLTSISFPLISGDLPNSMFSGCTLLETIDLPLIKTVGEFAFQDCDSLKDVTPLAKITAIKNNSFKKCDSLQNISFPLVVEVGDYAFSNCANLESINLPEVESVGLGTFIECSKLITLTGFDKLISIGPRAFEMTGITKLEFSNVETIGSSAFIASVNLTSVNLPKVKTIGDNCFNCCTQLTSINLPSVISIGYEAFRDCSALKDVVISSCQTIERQTFAGCMNINEIYLPIIQTIGNNAFSGCSSLTILALGNSLTSCGTASVPGTTTIYGYANSYAQTYATSNNIKFETINAFVIEKDLDTSLTKQLNENCLLEISTNGIRPTYQWYTTSDTIDNGQLIEGATNNYMEINTSDLGTKKYFCKITNWDNQILYSSICEVIVDNSSQIYTITWKTEDGITLATDYLKSGVTPEFKGDIPTKKSTAQYSYIFDGWTPAISAVTEDVIYTAVFNRVVNKYTITFYDYDNSIIQVGNKNSQLIEYGSLPTLPTTPQRNQTDNNKFVFNAWYSEQNIKVTDFTVTGEANYYANYTIYSLIKDNGDFYTLDAGNNNFVLIEKNDMANISKKALKINFNNIQIYISTTAGQQLSELSSDIKICAEITDAGDNLNTNNIKNPQLVDVTLFNGNEIISDFGSITVRVKYNGANKDSNQPSVWGLTNNNLTKMTNVQYQDGYLEFEISKSSQYVLGIENEDTINIKLIFAIILIVSILISIAVIVIVLKKK